MRLGKRFIRVCIEQSPKFIMIDQSVSRLRLLDLMVTAAFPLARMFHDTGPDHVQIRVHQAPLQMLTGFNRGGMIAVLPEGALAAFAPVVFLTGPACYQLHGSGYKFTHMDVSSTPWANTARS